MHIGFRRPHIGSLINQLAGQADRQIGRQFEMRKIELLYDLIGRQLPGERRQQVALLSQLLLERRQQLFGLRQRRILREHIRLAPPDRSIELPFQDIEQDCARSQ